MRPLTLAALLALVPQSVTHAQVAEIQKVHASQASSSDLFGRSVAASGSRVLVGASHEGAVASTSGAAYIYDRQNDGSWLEMARMFPADAAAGDAFGEAVALSGDRALIGAVTADGPAGSDQGSAYVFERQNNGTWIETAKLTPASPVAGDQFGDAVALSGDYAAVGTYRNDEVDTNSGKVWVFERQNNGSWLEVAELLAGDASEFGQFGWSLSLSGDTLLVGADRDSSATGAAYVFERSGGGSWSETQKLVGSDSNALDHFGWSVAIDGDLAVVGAYNAETSTDPFSWDEGAAYVFGRDGGVWSQVERFEASDAEAKDEFGYSVGISGQRVIVGAWNEEEAAADAGAAYLYELVGGGWIETKLVASDAAAHDLFGYSSAISGDVIVVGARNDDDFGSSSGSGYLFDAEPLSATGASISLSAGGSQTFELDAGHLRAGELYAVLGSVSGASPGLSLAPGVVLPLNFDFYFNVTLLSPNSPPLENTVSTLNSVGHSTAAFTFAPGANPGLAGLTLHHAYVTLAPGLIPSFASNAVALELVP